MMPAIVTITPNETQYIPRYLNLFFLIRNFNKLIEKKPTTAEVKTPTIIGKTGIYVGDFIASINSINPAAKIVGTLRINEYITAFLDSYNEYMLSDLLYSQAVYKEYEEWKTKQ